MVREPFMGSRYSVLRCAVGLDMYERATGPTSDIPVIPRALQETETAAAVPQKASTVPQPRARPAVSSGKTRQPATCLELAILRAALSMMAWRRSCWGEAVTGVPASSLPRATSQMETCSHVNLPRPRETLVPRRMASLRFLDAPYLKPFSLKSTFGTALNSTGGAAVPYLVWAASTSGRTSTPWNTGAVAPVIIFAAGSPSLSLPSAMSLRVCFWMAFSWSTFMKDPSRAARALPKMWAMVDVSGLEEEAGGDRSGGSRVGRWCRCEERKPRGEK
mmetsp:Transcript_33906/g.107713  ORF Transcript_33906/g.107713 Transcript_33906/m.107713 type:complete len:276 (+) Transcript_33906:404-1231(+)